MELFDKIYNCYYQVVRQILSEAAGQPVTRSRMTELSMKYGYLESGLTIVPKLTDGTWPLLEPVPEKGERSNAVRYRPVLRHPELWEPGNLPLTRLQKSWLKAILRDCRIRLFLTDEQRSQAEAFLADAEPLFHLEDFRFFDRYLDGDPYPDASYRENFQTILRALKEEKALIIAYENRRGKANTFEAAPYQLQYSAKDDKFRLCCLKYSGRSFHQNTVLNVSRIRACHLSRRNLPDVLSGHLPARAFRPVSRCTEPVLIEISGERNSLERCMLHFANYEKHTRYQEETGTWLCSIYYDLADETELLIDILSFGPVIQVLGPEPFLHQIRQRVKKQHELFYGTV